MQLSWRPGYTQSRKPIRKTRRPRPQEVTTKNGNRSFDFVVESPQNYSEAGEFSSSTYEATSLSSTGLTEAGTRARSVNQEVAIPHLLQVESENSTVAQKRALFENVQMEARFGRENCDHLIGRGAAEHQHENTRQRRDSKNSPRPSAVATTQDNIPDASEVNYLQFPVVEEKIATQPLMKVSVVMGTSSTSI